MSKYRRGCYAVKKIASIGKCSQEPSSSEIEY